MQNNQFVEALVIFPAYKESYYAAKGEGVCCNGNKMVIPRPNPSEKEIVFVLKLIKMLKRR